MATPDSLRYNRIPRADGSGAIPAVGFGTLIPDPLATKQATKIALEVGFRHPAAQAALAGGSGTVQGVYDALASTMKSGGTLGGGSGRFAQLAPVIRTSFDVDLPGLTGIYWDRSRIRRN